MDSPQPNCHIMTTTATTTAADLHAKIWAENARIDALRRAMYAWRADPVSGPTCLVKDVAREHGATDREITRAYLRVSADLRPNACESAAVMVVAVSAIWLVCWREPKWAGYL